MTAPHSVAPSAGLPHTLKLHLPPTASICMTLVLLDYSSCAHLGTGTRYHQLPEQPLKGEGGGGGREGCLTYKKTKTSETAFTGFDKAEKHLISKTQNQPDICTNDNLLKAYHRGREV